MHRLLSRLIVLMFVVPHLLVTAATTDCLSISWTEMPSAMPATMPTMDHHKGVAGSCTGCDHGNGVEQLCSSDGFAGVVAASSSPTLNKIAVLSNHTGAARKEALALVHTKGFYGSAPLPAAFTLLDLSVLLLV